MGVANHAKLLQVADDGLEGLRAQVRAKSSPAKLVERARIVLLANHRHGTTTLFAALEVATGLFTCKVPSSVGIRWRPQPQYSWPEGHLCVTQPIAC